jgi:O-antigen ligase
VPLASERTSNSYKLVLFLWLAVLFEPQWFIATVTGVIGITKVTLICCLATGILAFPKRPKKIWLLPLFVMVVYTILTFRLATNPAYAERTVKMLLLYYLMALGMVVFVKTPKQVTPFIAAMMGWQFLWWTLWGDASGLVIWHPQYANYDGYGPLMALGVAASFHLGMALTSRWQKLVMYGTSLLCVLGIVSAYQRGAFLALIAVLLFAWLRSNRKGMMTVGLVAAAIGVLVAATVIFKGDARGRDTQTSFFAEMATITDEGGTRGDREILWGAAITIWKVHPLMGVGGQSFGPFASQYFKIGDIEGDYALNPLKLYERQLHNGFVQILCEYGLIGAAIMLWLFVDFWKRNWKLQKKQAAVSWKAQGGKINLRAVALGLESMMIAFMAGAMFYNTLETNWLYTLVALNALLYRLTCQAPAPARR